jgi:hypothetical protein
MARPFSSPRTRRRGAAKVWDAARVPLAAIVLGLAIYDLTLWTFAPSEQAIPPPPQRAARPAQVDRVRVLTVPAPHRPATQPLAPVSSPEPGAMPSTPPLSVRLWIRPATSVTRTSALAGAAAPKRSGAHPGRPRAAAGTESLPIVVPPASDGTAASHAQAKEQQQGPGRARAAPGRGLAARRAARSSPHAVTSPGTKSSRHGPEARHGGHAQGRKHGATGKLPKPPKDKGEKKTG